jgi:dTDP-glucose 4,6-dehydratase
MKILVTGGAGFIGSNFVHYMVNKYKEYKIINLDALTYAGNLENLVYLENKSNYTFVQGDITNQETIESIFNSGVDYVVNFAAESHVDRSITDPGIFIRTNIQGTQVLLDASKKYDVKKYVQISTDEVYGTLGKEGYFTESTPLQPNSPYSSSKASSDLIALAYSETFKMNVSVTNCSNNYGPYQHHEKLIPHMISLAMQDKQLPVYGQGLNIRDWLFVEDHCEAIDIILHEGKKGERYNIGGHNEKRNIEIVKLILERLGKPETLISYVEDRKGHDYRYAIDPTKLKNEFGWEPKTMFKDGIVKTIDWYLAHPEYLMK